MANNADLLKLAKERLKDAEEKDLDNRRTAKEDMEFAYNMGENGQWPKHIRQRRTSKKRPCLTINLLDKFIGRLVGEQKANRVRIKVLPVDSDNDPDLAEVYNDIIRNIESNSSAETAYDTAYEHAVSGGFGYFRILTQYLDDESFNQEIRIKRILNPFSVYFDPESSEFDFSDAKYCFIYDDMRMEEFKKEYPDANSANLTSDNELNDSWWGAGSETIRIAEYYYKKDVTKILIYAISGIEDGVYLFDTEEEVNDLIKNGYEVIKRRKVKTHKVMWAKISANDMLEGPEEIDCKYIPVVPVLGQEIYIEGRRRLRSLIRDAKDPQRAYNYYRSMAAELISLAPKAPFILTPTQVQGHESKWKKANTESEPYLLVNDTPYGIPKRQAMPAIPTAAVQEAAIAKQDLEDSIGLYSASLGKGGNERSGLAIKRRVDQSSAITYTFVDNFRRALIYTGKILVDLIPKIYDTERTIRIRGENEKIIEINKTIYNLETEETEIINDISKGKFDVEIDIGAFYSTKRAETADYLLQILQYAPDLAPVLITMIMENLDIPGGEKFVSIIKEFVSGGAGGAQQTQQPNPPVAG